MRQQSRWARRFMKCPEGRGESHLFLQWRLKKGGEILNSVSCDNLHLRDLSGSDCQWSCWEKISKEDEA